MNTGVVETVGSEVGLAQKLFHPRTVEGSVFLRNLHREARCNNDTILNAAKRVTVCGIFTQQENPNVHMDFEGPWGVQSNL